MSHYNNNNRGYSSRRRASPTYDDYDGPSSQPSTRPRSPPSYDSFPARDSERSSYFNERNTSNYNSNSYSNYRAPRRPWNDSEPSHHPKLDYYGHEEPIRSSPPASSLPPPPPPASRSPYRKRTVSPAPVARTEPTPEYLLTADTPSKHLEDPTCSRKLLVLDLNGSLLVRSPHRKPATLPRNAPYDPYAEPTRPRALRTVHPRPYMQAFRDYLFHDETKKWLDTMVWSSAQPHSVADMVGKAFEERKGELKAVWARDTLGLSSDQYHQKTQTTKDLEKPWAEISALRAPSASIEDSASHSQPKEPKNEVASQSHSAHTTLLMDDSPLKAILQPWNHLCISEYTTAMRRDDLATLEIETLKKRRQKSVQPDTEGVAGSQGEMKDAERFTSEEPGDENNLEDEKRQRKKEKKARKQEQRRQEKEDELIAKLVSTGSGEKPVSSSSDGSASAAVDKLLEQTAPSYEPTLLAAIGILEHIKYEDNVAAWMKSGGLVQVPGLEGVVDDSEGTAADEKTTGPVEEMVNDAGSKIPVVDISIDLALDRPEGLNTAKSGSGREHSPPSHGGTPIPSKKRRVSDESQESPSRSEAPTSLPNSTVASAPESVDGAVKKQWFENPIVLAYWARKGQDALAKLEIPVESGVVG